MSVFDLVLLSAILMVSLWWIAAPTLATGRRLFLSLALAVGCLAQLYVEGFYWQFLPAYLSLMISACPPIGRGVLLRRFGMVFGTGLLFSTMATWVLLPVPRLPDPGGPFGVGSETFRWVDPARLEIATEDASDHRNVVVQAWYPVAPGTTGPRPDYMDGLNQLPESIAGIPSFIFRHFDRVDTHAAVGAPISNENARWPVVIFSPGYGAPRAFYNGLVTRLASQGFVVLALDHPYEAAVTKLADGRVVGFQQRLGRSDAKRAHYMDDQAEVRVADLIFALDQIAGPDGLGPMLSNHLEVRRVATMGHSFGGATAVLAMDRDPRIQAAVDVDGYLWGAYSGQRLRGPVLMLESDHKDSPNSRAFVARTLAILDRKQQSGFRYRIQGTHHFSFTDPPLFFSPPGQLVLSRVLGATRSATETQAITADMILSFLRGSLLGQPQDLQTVAARQEALVGGPIGTVVQGPNVE